MKYAKHLLILLPFVGLFLWVYGRFDGLYGQDSFSYYTYATGPLTEAMPGLPPPFFWPPGYPLLVWLVSLVVGPTPLAGQLVSLLGGAATAVFTALLMHELRMTNNDSFLAPRSSLLAPLLAGLLVAFNGQLWQSSVVVMSDTPALAFATLGVWAVVKYGRSTHPSWLALATFAVSYAVLTRWALAFVAIIAAGYVLLILWRQPGKTAVGHFLLAATITLLVLFPVTGAIWQFLTAPNPHEPNFVVDLQVVKWNPLNAFRRTFETSDGVQTYNWPSGLYYGLAIFHLYYFTPVMGIFVLPGLWGCWRAVRHKTGLSTGDVSKKTPPWLSPSLFVLLWAALVYFFLAGIAWQNFRFTLAYLPPVAIITAVGLLTVYDRLPANYQWLGAGYLVIGLAAMGIGGWVLTERFIERKADDLTAVSWVETHTPADSRIISLNMTATLQQYSHRQIEELYYLTPADLETLLADGMPTYLFIDVASVTNQWRDLSPGQNYQWLRDTYGLREIGRERTFTLFLINP